jgi:hypothetical protein
MNKKIHEVSIIETNSAFLRLTVDGKPYQLPWEDCSPRLAKASYAQRIHMEVSPSGYGIHWPEIDEDLAITPLIEQASAEIRQVAEKKAKYGE